MIFAGMAILSQQYEWAEKRLEPVKEKASEVAKDLGESLKPPAQEAAESVKTTAQEGVESVKQEGQAGLKTSKNRLRTPRRRSSSKPAELLRDSGGFTSPEVDSPLLFLVAGVSPDREFSL
jgi:hypothetical protein